MTFLCLLTLLYFLPTIVAGHRGHHVTGILLLNLFFGWTGVGWAAMLAWALLSRPAYVMVAVPQYGQYADWRR